ncbi:MAG: hypothetical protein WA629_09150 [Candidatus Aquilonibacter sp.]
MSASPLEVRIAHLEGAYEQINHRLGSVEQRLGSLERKIDDFRDSLLGTMEGRFGQIDQRFARMDQKFNWVFGLIVVSILIPLVERFVVR